MYSEKRDLSPKAGKPLFFNQPYEPILILYQFNEKKLFYIFTSLPETRT